MAATHFRIDTRRLSFRECWWQSRSPVVLLLWVLKLLHIRLPVPVVLPHLSSTRDLEIPADAVPSASQTRLQPVLAELTGLGFHSPTFYRYTSSRGQLDTILVAMLHPAGDAVARVMHVVNRLTHPPQEKLRVFFLSPLRDGSWFVTSPQRQEFERPAGVRVVIQLHADATRLWQVHAAELAKLRDRNPPAPVLSREEAEAVSDHYEELHYRFQTGRGVYQPLSETEEIAEQAEVRVTQAAAAEVGQEHADVLVELEKQANPKGSWKGALWLLALSVLAFVAIGGAQWDWEYVLLLLPVLFFHEAGHWLAMRLFGYRNLRMFFIPLLGAAVSGHNYNVAGWKKALVSLAGPLPGIVLGTVAAVALVAFPGHELLEKLVLVTLLLNAFNLLPFVPLDGGWVLNAVLFCRRPWLQTGFQLFAVLVLFGAFFVTGDKIWLFLGILMAISLPTTWRTSRVAHQLRAQGMATQSLDRRTIPASTATAIITQLKAGAKLKRNAKTLATETLNTFEGMNARPPGVLATLALLVTYAGTLALAVVGFTTLSLGRDGGLGLLNALADLPSEPLNPPLAATCQDTAVWRSGAALPAMTNRLVLIGQCESPAAAKALWPQLTNAVPPIVSRVGTVVFASLTADDTKTATAVAELLQPLGTNFLHFDSRSNAYLFLNLTMQPSPEPTGTNLATELAEFFALPGTANAAPPWLAGFALTPEQKQARHTWRALQEMSIAVENSKELREARRAMFRALTKGDTNVMAAAARTVDETRTRLLNERRATLLASAALLLLPELVELERQRESAGRDETGRERFDYQQHYREVGRLTGPLPAQTGGPDPEAAAVSAYGGVKLEEGRLAFRGLGFERVELGLPTLFDWLCAQGATELRFEIHVPELGDEE